MDPLLELSSSRIHMNSLIELEYFTSSLDRLTDKYIPTPIESAVPTELSNMYDNTYTTIRDIMDGITLPKINNRAENKLRNLIAMCPNLITKEFRREWTVAEMLTITDIDWKIIDIASGPGSWSSLLLNSYPSCSVTGYTLDSFNPDFRWYPFLLPNPKFSGIYGDLIEDSIDPSKRSRLIQDNSFDLCLCDGGVDIDGVDDLEDRMMDKLRLLTAEFITCLRVGKVGSHALIKLFKIGIINTQHLINMMACAYDHCAIVKPITTRSMSSEAYLICLSKRTNYRSSINAMNDYLTIKKRPVVLLDPIARDYMNMQCIIRKANNDEAYDQAIRLYKTIKNMEEDEQHKFLTKAKKNKDWVIPSNRNINLLTLKSLLKIYS